MTNRFILSKFIYTFALTALASGSAYAGNCSAPAAAPGAIERFIGEGYKVCNGATSSWESFELTTTGVACTTANAIDFDTAAGKFKVCDGGSWKTIGCAEGCASFGVCTVAGRQQFSVADNSTLYCDGTNWRKAKSAPLVAEEESGLQWAAEESEFSMLPDQNTCGVPAPAGQPCDPFNATCQVVASGIQTPYRCLLSGGGGGGGGPTAQWLPSFAGPYPCPGCPNSNDCGYADPNGEDCAADPDGACTVTQSGTSEEYMCAYMM